MKGKFWKKREFWKLTRKKKVNDWVKGGKIREKKEKKKKNEMEGQKLVWTKKKKESNKQGNKQKKERLKEILKENIDLKDR